MNDLRMMIWIVIILFSGTCILFGGVTLLLSFLLGVMLVVVISKIPSKENGAMERREHDEH